MQGVELFQRELFLRLGPAELFLPSFPLLPSVNPVSVFGLNAADTGIQKVTPQLADLAVLAPDFFW